MSRGAVANGFPWASRSARRLSQRGLVSRSARKSSAFIGAMVARSASAHEPRPQGRHRGVSPALEEARGIDELAALLLDLEGGEQDEVRFETDGVEQLAPGPDDPVLDHVCRSS